MMTATVTTTTLGQSLQEARQSRGLSVKALAQRAGVSRAMIAKVERGEAQATAILLGRLSGALGMTLSQLVARAEEGQERLVRAADQPEWVDPETGYRRRAISPAGGALELVEVALPPGARVSYPPDSYRFIHQQLWVLHGHLAFQEGATEHHLDPGDCLVLGDPEPCAFANPGTCECRYLVAVARR